MISSSEQLELLENLILIENLKTPVGRRGFLELAKKTGLTVLTAGIRVGRIGSVGTEQVQTNERGEGEVRLFPGSEIYVRYPSFTPLSFVKLAFAFGSSVSPTNQLDLDGDGKVTIFDLVIASQGYNKEPTHLYLQEERGGGKDFLQLTLVSPSHLCGWNIDWEELFKLFYRLPQGWPGLTKPVRLGIEVVTMVRGPEIVNPRQSAVFQDPSSGCLAIVLTLRDLGHPTHRNSPDYFNRILMEQLLERLKGESLTQDEKRELVPTKIFTITSSPPSKPFPGWPNQHLQHI